MDTATRNGTWSGLEELREILRSFLRRHTRDENEVEDVIQETFVRAARFRARLSEPRRLRSWTMRIALNVLADHRRRDRRVTPEDPPELVLEAATATEDGPPPEEPLRLGNWEIDREEALRQLASALESLRDEDRRLLSSFYAGAESCRETAGECGIPPHLVKVRLFRARRRLARLLRQRLACSAGARHAPEVS